MHAYVESVLNIMYFVYLCVCPCHHPIAIVDGLEATPILNMCLRYQEHLSTVASVMANEQVSEMTLVYGTPF